MENFKDEDYQFRGPFADTGYKFYYEQKNKEKFALLVESKINQDKVDDLKVKFKMQELVEVF